MIKNGKSFLFFFYFCMITYNLMYYRYPVGTKCFVICDEIHVTPGFTKLVGDYSKYDIKHSLNQLDLTHA